MLHTPDWKALAQDPNWIAMWESPESPVHQEVERLERRLHDERTTPDETVKARHRLAALRELHERVAALALQPAKSLFAAPNVLDATAADAGSLLGRVRRVASRVSRSSVLPPSFGS